MYDNTAFADLESWGSRRSASLMDSIQVYSCYMSFSLWSVVFLSPFKRKFINFIFAIIIGIFGLSGGSQAFVLFLCLFVIMRAGINLLSIVVAISILYIGGALDLFLDNGGPLARFSSLLNDGADFFSSLNSDRFDVWALVISLTNPIYGNGLGSSSVALSGGDRFNTESYFLNIYYEGGLIFLVPFLLFFVQILYRNLLVNYEYRSAPYVFALMFLIYGFSVHVYYSVMLFFIWFLFFFVQKGSVKEGLRTTADAAVVK
jgi:hypothetical protein